MKPTPHMTVRQRSLAAGPAHQRGAVLVVSLIFLILLTILALSASSGSIMQLRMAGNLRDAQMARMSANTALRGVEWKLWTHAKNIGQIFLCGRNGTVDATTGCIVYNPKDANAYGNAGTITNFRHQGNDWAGGIGVSYMGPGDSVDYTSSGPTTAQLAGNPVYIIEDLGRVRKPGSGPARESGAPPGGPAGSGAQLHSYRITARAQGGNSNTVRVIQSTFDASPSN